jgi:DNA-binding winged helix-turn-helix (wHTH) protein/tetratricopeptide (TPR) repeat protein
MIYDFGAYRVDARRIELTRNGEPVALKRKAVQMLVTLIERRGGLVTKDELVREVWGRAGTSPNNLAQHVFMLRAALADSGVSILTVPRVGYRFVGEVQGEAEESAGAVLAQHYCRNAKHLWEMRTYSSILSAISLYQCALQEDPRCADAYAGLAVCRFLLAEYTYEPQRESLLLAERDAFRALELDSRHAFAYVILAVCAVALRYAWREAEQLCLSAIRLQPELLWAHVVLIEHYIFEGRLSHARQALAHAQSLGAIDDPFPRIPLLRGLLHYFSGAYGAAIAELTALVGDHPTYALARFTLAKALIANGDYAQAQAHVDEVLRGGYDPLRPGQPNVRERTMTLAVVIRAASGDRAGARRAALALASDANDRRASSVCKAIAAMGAGDLDTAMDFLKAGIAEHDALIGYVVADPLLAPLRSHPQWRRALEQLRLAS